MKKIIRSLKLSNAIFMVASISIIFTFIIGYIGFSGMKEINTNIDKMYDDRLIPITEATSIRSDFLNIRIQIGQAIISYNKDIDSKIQDYDERIEKRYKNYTSSKMDDQEIKEIGRFKSDYDTYKNTWKEVRELTLKGEKPSEEQIKKLYDLGQDIEDSLRELKDYDVKVAGDLNSEADKIYNANYKAFLLIFLVAVTVILALSFYISIIINKATKNMLDIMDTVAEGDFTVEMETEGRNEFIVMRRYMKKTIENISTIINDIKQSSDTIDDSSENLSSVAEEMASSADNVSNAIQDAARGTGEQAEDLINITNIINDFGVELEGMITSIKEIDVNTKGIHTLALNSNGDMESLTESVNRVRDAFENLITTISNVGKNVNQINEITDMIKGISEQTNLLALNAAIEAARAGEAGKGFSVVAEEIRTLAEQTQESLDSINNLVNGISNDTGTMIKTTEVMKEELTNQRSDIDTAIKSFDNITKAVEEVTPKIDSVNVSAEKIDREKNIILEKIEGASSIAEEVSASAEEIAASSEEMSASTLEVSDTAQKLNDMTKDMMNKVSKFKTR